MTQPASTDDGFPGIAVWNVVFMSGDLSSWWDYLTHPDWRHVCAFGYSKTTDSWVIYDVADKCSRISVVDSVWFDRWLDTRKHRFTAVLQMPTLPGGDVRARLGLWCVTAMKHLLGVRSGALRPYALYRDLQRSGAIPAFEKLYGRQSETPAGRSGDESAPGAG